LIIGALQSPPWLGLPGLVAPMIRAQRDEHDGAPDAVLMQRLAAGDAQALGPLFERYAVMVGSLLLRLAPSLSSTQAEDLTQEVFVTLLETASRYREQDKLRSWLCGIAARKARGWQRRSWFRSTVLRQNAPDGAGIAGPATQVDERLAAKQQLGHAMNTLQPKQREVLVLHVIEEMSGDEIAEALGISTNAVWVRLHRARKAVAAALGENP